MRNKGRNSWEKTTFQYWRGKNALTDLRSHEYVDESTVYENMMLMMIWTDVSLILIIAGEICGIDVKRQNPT